MGHENIVPVSLSKVRDGIYSLNGFNPQNPHRVVVAVPPYFLGYDINEVSFRDDHQDYLTYLPRFNRLVQNHKGPLVTLESAWKTERTASKYRALGRTDNSYFIVTWPASPRPIELRDEWEEVAKFLKEFDTMQTVCLVGGQLIDSDDIDPAHHGCLGRTFYELRKGKIPVEILRKVTFP